MRVRVELSSLASQHRSGVAAYTKLLTQSLAQYDDTEMYGHYFNFLKRQPITELPSSKRIRIEENIAIPLRIYAKTQSYGTAPPFDLHLPPVDLTILPNFATWPTVKSRLRATVVHDLTYLYHPEVVEEKNLDHLRRVVPRSMKEADFIITVSETVKAELIKEFSINPDKCIATPIPPDEAFFKQLSPEEIETAKDKYEIDSEKYIYFIGNLEPRKNLTTLIEAYRALPKDIKKSHKLIMAGGKGWKTEATQRALDEAISAGENVKHLGFIDQTDSPALYQGASLFVMPSLYEGFGMPVLEAMASGCSVVASDIPVLREAGGTAATYANPLNSESFTSAIVKALNSPKPPRSLLLKNISRFSWEKNASLVISTADRLLN